MKEKLLRTFSGTLIFMQTRFFIGIKNEIRIQTWFEKELEANIIKLKKKTLKQDSVLKLQDDNSGQNQEGRNAQVRVKWIKVRQFSTPTMYRLWVYNSVHL